MSAYAFEHFMKDVEARVRQLCRLVVDPDFIWPGVLILDVADGLESEAFVIGETACDRERLVEQLVAKIRDRHPRRFAWIMPCLREEPDGLGECLLIVFGERRQVEAAVADLRRQVGRGPRLGAFSHGAFGSGARRVSGRFVDPLLDALRS